MARVHPNAITIAACCFSLFFLIAMIQHMYLLACFFLLLSLTDALDGAVARAYNKESAFGALLDSTLDRVSDAFFIAAFAFAGVVSWYIIFPVIITAYLTSYVRGRGEDLFKVSLSGVGLIERTERIIFIGAGLLFLVFIPRENIFTTSIFLLLLTLSTYTVLQRLSFLNKSKNRH